MIRPAVSGRFSRNRGCKAFCGEPRSGEVVLEKVMSDEAVQPGDRVLTSGGDQIFPKGLPVGTVTKVSPGPELFLNIRVKPAVNLSRLEEVLVIIQQTEKEPSLAESGLPMRAVDILAQRLPSVPDSPPDDPNQPPPPTSGLKILPAPTTQTTPGTPLGPGGPKITTRSQSGQGSTTPVGETPKPHAGAANNSGSPSTTKPNSSTVTPPAIPRASAPAAFKIPSNGTNAASDGQSAPPSTRPDTQAKPPASEPKSTQEPPQ